MPSAHRGWRAGLVRRTLTRMAVVLALAAGVTALNVPAAFAWHLNLTGDLDCEGTVTLHATSWSTDEDEQAETIEISYQLTEGGPWTSVTPQPDWSVADGEYTFEPISLAEVPEQVRFKAYVTWMHDADEPRTEMTGWLNPPANCETSTPTPTESPTTSTPTETPTQTPTETPTPTPTETPTVAPAPKPAAELFSDCEGFHVILDNTEGTAPATFEISGPEGLSTTETVPPGEVIELVAPLDEATTATFTVESEGMETVTEELSFEPCEVPPGKDEEKKPVKDVDFKNVNALPKTGAGANLAAALVGLVLVGGGVGLVLYSRRRRLPGVPTSGAGS